ncbi:Bug family tripartite tricarboxylate transporter substrate binding protein [Caenimonas aquaedulcis]|uniref:Tripartite tricarboxylate transporter substrate binding protein n=1 Tax=Caenimonas aquaedulcis TaxID=2793270 RepID=A0A931H149_9BURK|nr:tripartite tricarboxylate transporter substrate binding protein [Caenimonas aquaedulcis]MBG9386638.1 tripartite tricarboxylate transporter substrate binding protein [Caenimonas aquaedulcis]
MYRRNLIAAALAAGVFPRAFAQAGWPGKPIRLVVPFPPGGGTDTASRLIAEKFTTVLGWTVIVDNKPGAGGNIGIDFVAKSAPDGYTIGMGQASNLAINPSLYAKMPFDPLKDLTPIVAISEQPVVLVVRADSPYRTFADFVKAAQAKPGAIGIAQAGNGTVGHLAGELLERQIHAQIMQVPYKGAGPAMNELLGGQVPAYFGSSPSVMPQLAGGKIRALAVTSARRLGSMSAVPTVAEQGYPGFAATTWLGLVGPAGMPADVVNRISSETLKLLARPEVKEKLEFDGSEVTPGNPQQFAAHIKAEHAKWGALIKEANIKLE